MEVLRRTDVVRDTHIPLQMKFEFSDCWLLTSICNTEQQKSGAELKDIIAYADMINHSIISWNELSNGLIKLKSMGLIDVETGRVHVKEVFKIWWQKQVKNKTRIYLLKQVEEVSHYLNKFLPITQIVVDDNPSGFIETDYQLAVDNYLALFKK